MTARVFIDGQEGTTGLQIHDRLAGRADLRVVEIDPARRKDPEARLSLMREVDVAILCLPDDAAVESAALAAQAGTRVIDASTAHRVAEDWVYGLPELAPGQRDAVRGAARVANPGCYPTGMLLALRPLVDAGLVGPGHPVTVHALSGYSGGGKKMIQAFAAHPAEGQSPDWTIRSYALGLAHKHVPEMRVHGGLERSPIFCPAVGSYYQGMLVHVPLHVRDLARRTAVAEIHALLSDRYGAEPFITVLPPGGGGAAPDGFLSPTALNGTNRLELLVSGNDEQVLLTARLDNLGKGASGAAVQNLNLMLDLPEASGL
ncbi:MAG: N-acetyl-gamma-glutamyl-phosphate reductase [Deltaproteobacteria bacterium]|nr:N-acetyl-gamma-glutamyl-phosphate reductase [Deltaproteobacteria bacterium]